LLIAEQRHIIKAKSSLIGEDMLNRLNGLIVVLLFLVIGLTTYVHWSTSKASVATENLSTALKRHEGARLYVKRESLPEADGRVLFVGEDYLQGGSRAYYPFSAIVRIQENSNVLTIELR
jgi:hypothetical protein